MVRKGRVYTKTGRAAVSKSSGSSSKKSRSSSSSAPKVYTVAVHKQTGESFYLVNGKKQKSRPKNASASTPYREDVAKQYQTQQIKTQPVAPTTSPQLRPTRVDLLRKQFFIQRQERKPVPVSRPIQKKSVLKSVGEGVYEVGEEILTLSKDAIVESFKYGKNLRKRFEAGENNPIFNDIKKLATGTKDVGKFVAENPKEAATIVGLAVSEGGKQFGSAFQKDPVKTTTKAAIYLFPGTIIKGGVKTAGAGAKTIKSVKEAKNFANLEKKVKTVRTSLTASQNAKLTKRLSQLSKVAGAKTRETKLTTTIKKYAKEQGIKIKKGSTFVATSKQLKEGSKVLDIGTKKGLKVTKKQPKKPIKIIDIKKKKVKRVATLPKEKPKIQRDLTKYIKLEEGKLTKVTKSEFARLTPKPKKGVKKPVKLIQLDKGKVTKVSRESPKLQSRDIFKGKKGQVRLFRASPVQVQTLVNKEVAKSIKKVSKIKRTKKPTKAQLRNTKKELELLKKFISSANTSKLFRGAGVLNTVNGLIKDINGKELKLSPQDKSPEKLPQKKKPVAKKTPGKKKKPLKTPAVIPKKAVKTPGKPVSPTKTPTKTKVVKKPRPVKKPRVIRKFKLEFGQQLPVGKRFAFDVLYRSKGKVRNLGVKLPQNSALKRAASLVDNTTARSMTIKIVGITSRKDISKPETAKFRLSKTKNALRLVEKRKHAIDTKGEKKGLTLSKRLRKK